MDENIDPLLEETPVLRKPDLPSEEDKYPAHQLLSKFLEENNIELKFPELITKRIDDGSLIVSHGTEIHVSYKK